MYVNNGLLEDRVKSLEEKIEKGIALKTQQVQNSNINDNNIKSENKKEGKNISPNIPKIKLDSNCKEVKNWSEVINELKKKGKIVLYTNLLHTNAVELNDMTVGINFPNGLTPFGKTVLENQENKREISNLVSQSYGKEMNIKYIDNKDDEIISTDENIANFANKNDIPFNFS